MCQLSRVTCHVSLNNPFSSFFISEKVVKLVGGGSVINEADPSIFFKFSFFSRFDYLGACPEPQHFTSLLNDGTINSGVKINV